MKRYKGTFNYQREVNVMYTSANSKGGAIQNFISKLAKKYGVTSSHIRNYFIDGHYEIEEVKEV
jgi:hypothetical protein